VHFFGPFLYRSAFHATTEIDECERALEHLEQVIALEGASTIAAIMLESIPGTAGIMLPPRGYLEGVRELCDRYGILLIADEVMAGFGRAGRWFAIEHSAGVVPDLLTFAKGVTRATSRSAGSRSTTRSTGPSPTRPIPAVSPTPATPWHARLPSRRSRPWRTRASSNERPGWGRTSSGPV
jgi:4-aminobutyrate aminotransferase-like enzyme